jgi:hypothetical protein
MTIEQKTPLGPNVKKLIIRKMSVDAIPSGGGLSEGISFLTKPGALSSGFKSAAEWVKSAIEVVRKAAEPNPWKDADDEAIAGELLRKIEERKHA